MSILLNIILFLALVVLFISFHSYIRKTSAMTQKMKNQIKALSIYFKCEDQSDPQPRLLIELIDPISIAKKQSNIAKIVSGIAPNIIISEVYREAKKRAILDVKRHNVEANINIIFI